MAKLNVVKRKDFEKVLIFIGCKWDRQRGSHIIYKKSGLKRPIVITSDRELSFRVVRSCLKTLNMTIEEYKDICKRI